MECIIESKAYLTWLTPTLSELLSIRQPQLSTDIRRCVHESLISSGQVKQILSVLSTLHIGVSH